VFPLESLAVDPWVAHALPTVGAAAVVVGGLGAGVVLTVVTVATVVDGRVVARPPEPFDVPPELQAPNTTSATPTQTRGRSLTIVASPIVGLP
jgi:hypothetical protein